MTRRGANEGTIRERKDGRWEARVLVTRPDGRRARRSLLGKTRAEVRDKLQAAILVETSGLPLPAERMTVGVFLEQWLRDSARPSVRPRTYVSYASVVRIHLAPALGHLPLARLSPQHVQAFLIAKSGVGLSPRTVGYLRAVLRQALGQAERWGMVTATPPDSPSHHGSQTGRSGRSHPTRRGASSTRAAAIASRPCTWSPSVWAYGKGRSSASPGAM
jgi:integrase